MFKFSMRQLLIFVALFGCLFAFVGHNAVIVAQRKAMRPMFNDDAYSLRSVGTTIREEPTIPWIRRILDDSPEYDLFYYPGLDRDGKQFQKAQKLFPEARIWGWPHYDDELPKG